MSIFIGRASEIELIKQQLKMESSRIVVINGRRRIGKSRLSEEIAKGYNFFSFTGLSSLECQDEPDKSKKQIQHFLEQLGKKTHKDYPLCSSWMKALYILTNEIPDNEKTVILFDEISWMGMDDRNFVGKLKSWWDTEIAHKKNVLLIFCGSVSTWIEKNIINSTAFYGRISLVINLQPLSIPEAAKFLRMRNFRKSAFDVLEILAVTGGVPWYLEQIDPDETNETNIKNLCFKRSGLLRNEFNIIFNDVFSKHGEVYNKILVALSEGAKTLVEIRNAIDYVSGGQLTEIMSNLVLCGFITKHQQWSLKTKKLGKQSIYRISDPYIHFYLKYIRPYVIEGRDGELPKGFDSIMGLQMESLLIQNRKLILKSLNIEHPIMDNPYVQRPTVKKPGCQIDYLVQATTNNLYLCEFKFRQTYIGRETIEEVQTKIKNLIIPRNTALVPVLFYMGELRESILTSNFFYKIIDLCDLLEK